jgi:hypothetical protein
VHSNLWSAIRKAATFHNQPSRFKSDIVRVKHWKIIADNLSKAGWSWGGVPTVDSRGRTIFVADAHRDDGKRFVVRADEKLTAFVELESAIRLYP